MLATACQHSIGAIHLPVKVELDLIGTTETAKSGFSNGRVRLSAPFGTGNCQSPSRGETPEAAARRELTEEIGLRPAAPLLPVVDIRGVWD
ncbi:NUDIX domain-containing protein, partial [Bradyrhizobium sp.]|uniref:NUDIX domain-containing protein n=1 Tax=Bradyrhizobium sp. TaxID=376 RepID=UPI002E04264C|nr:NUDIX domain-containing protein [Bradyrhizobium sp.]